MNLVAVVLLLSIQYGVSLQCSATEVKSLLEGCDHLRGLNVTSDGGTIVNDHNCGVTLPIPVFLKEPLFQYELADSATFYSLIVLDPDVPLHKEGEFFFHMLKSNIPGWALKSVDSGRTKGDDYKIYVSPTPLPGTGAHRYICLLYQQADGNNFQPDEAPLVRVRFNLADWLCDKNLCGPVAATQFLVQSVEEVAQALI